MVSWDTRMFSSSGYRVFGQPEICFGDQSRIITRNDVPQLQVDGKKAALGPQGRLPGFAVRLTGSIRRTPTMTCDLSAHGRRNSLQAFTYLANRPAGSEPSRSARRRSNPPVTRHQTTNRRMFFAKGTTDLMQRLPRLPTTPHVDLLLNGKPKPFPWLHKHHL